VVLSFVFGARTHAWLGSARTWLQANNATIMAILLWVIGVVIVGKGIDRF